MSKKDGSTATKSAEVNQGVIFHQTKEKESFIRLEETLKSRPLIVALVSDEIEKIYMYLYRSLDKLKNDYMYLYLYDEEVGLTRAHFQRDAEGNLLKDERGVPLQPVVEKITEPNGDKLPVEKVIQMFKSVRYVTKTDENGNEYQEPVHNDEKLTDTEGEGENESLNFINFSKSILFMEHAHWWLIDNPPMIQSLKNIIKDRKNDRILILHEHTYKVPDELKNDITLHKIGLPSMVDLKNIYKNVCFEYGLTPSNNTPIKLLQSALGLTSMEVSQAFKTSIAHTGKLDDSDESINHVIDHKKSIIDKSLTLQYIDLSQDKQEIGGLENLTKWIYRKGSLFTEKAAKSLLNLTPPKGVLLFGIPGTGKSATAKVVAKQWRLPLIRFDVTSVKGSLVGQSEKNMDDALRVIESMAPCIVWMDEIEKALAGSVGGGHDSGVSAGILNKLLTFLQENKKPIFVVATANSIDNIPIEFMRSGRFDGIFTIDLPGDKAREDIFNIYLKKRNSPISEDDMKTVVKLSKGYTGAEIESAVKEAAEIAFADGDRLINVEDLKEGITKHVVPLAKTMPKRILELQSKLKDIALDASDEPKVVLDEYGKAKKEMAADAKRLQNGGGTQPVSRSMYNSLDFEDDEKEDTSKDGK